MSYTFARVTKDQNSFVLNGVVTKLWFGMMGEGLPSNSYGEGDVWISEHSQQDEIQIGWYYNPETNMFSETPFPEPVFYDYAIINDDDIVIETKHTQEVLTGDNIILLTEGYDVYVGEYYDRAREQFITVEMAQLLLLREIRGYVKPIPAQ